MALDAFATAADVATRLGVTFTPAEEAQLASLLDDASNELRAITGQPINRLTSTVKLWMERPGAIYLPAVPVVAVASVTRDGAVLPHRLRYDELLVPAARVGDELTVTFTHGWDPIPGELVKYACVMAASAFAGAQQTGALGQVAGVTRRQESIDDYTVAVDAGSAGEDVLAASMSLPQRLVERLRATYGARNGISWIEVGR